MCYFATFIATEANSTELAEKLKTECGFGLSSYSNRSLAKLLSSNEEAFYTDHFCNCDWGYDLNPQRNAFDVERQRRKLVAKGWSPAKIERSLANKLAHRDKNEHSGNRLDTVDLICRAMLILQEHSRGDQVGFFMHFYRGQLDTELLHPVPVEVQADGLADALRAYQDDQLLRICR